MKVRTGMRVAAARRLGDTVSALDPGYVVLPGEKGTLRSILRNLEPDTLDLMGVEWDKLPGIVNGIEAQDVVLV